jgi:uncharacterized protein (TIGR03083 family)
MQSPSIDNLAATWASLDSLLSSLDEAEWKLPTGCPGWSVQDNVSHLIDYESGALGRPRPTHALVDGDGAGGGGLAHVRNDLGQANEVGVDFRRSLPGADVLAEFRDVTAARLAQLRSLPDEDLAREMDLPVGRGTMADMLTLRVMDTWSHEQDIRRAVGRPGHVDGPAVDEAVAYFSQYLPIVVVKRAAAPDGARVVFELEGLAPFSVVVDGGRGSLVRGGGAGSGGAAGSGSGAVFLRMPVTVFDALVCGRADVGPSDVEVSGDDELGQRVVGSLGFMV